VVENSAIEFMGSSFLLIFNSNSATIHERVVSEAHTNRLVIVTAAS